MGEGELRIIKLPQNLVSANMLLEDPKRDYRAYSSHPATVSKVHYAPSSNFIN